MHSLPRAAEPEDENLGLGLALTAVQVLGYFAFVLACCFAPSFIQGERLAGGLPAAIVGGLGVIALGTVLTVVYVTLTNRRGTAA